MIYSEHLFTGDGLATALNVLRIMADTGKELSELAGQLVTYPQVLVNVRVKQKTDLSTVPAIASTMKKVEQGLAGNGRLLVRYSGTEPLLRIMLEGQDDQEIRGWADEIAGVVREHLAHEQSAVKESTVKSSVNSGQVISQRQQGSDRAQFARRTAFRR